MINFNHIKNDIPYYKDMLFLNSAGASLMPKTVVKSISSYLNEEEKHGGYKVKELYENILSEFYVQASILLNCAPQNIAFTHDATDAYSKALSSIAFKPNDVLITSDDDYASNHIQFLSLAERYGIKIYRIKNLENGDLDINDFKRLVDQHTPKLVAITHVPTNSGMVQNVTDIGEICHQNDILFLVDACQSVGQIEVDVQKIKCDFLSATGRKFLRGPRGTGFLYVSDRVLALGYKPLMIDGRGAVWKSEVGFDVLTSAKRFETWEAPYALTVGFAKALLYGNTIGVENIQAYNATLMKKLQSNLTSIKNIQIQDKGSQQCNILTFVKNGKSLQEIKEILDKHRVYFTVSTLEWGVIDYAKKGIHGSIRLSPHYFNTLEEMDQVSEIIENI